MPLAPMDFMTPEERQMLLSSGMLSDAQLKPPALGPFNVSPQIENAPAPQFMPMEQPGNSFLDRLATAIGQAGPPPVNRFDSPRSQALQSLVGGLATGFAGKRQQSMDERQSVQDSLRQQTAWRNQRAIIANESAREKRIADAIERGKMLKATKDKQDEEAKTQAGYLPVPSWVSRALYGDDSLTGKRRKDTDTLMARAWSKLDGGKKSGGGDSLDNPKLSRAEYIRLSAKKVTLERRAQQMQNKLDAVAGSTDYRDKERAQKLQDDLDGVNAELEGINSTLDEFSGKSPAPQAEADPAPAPAETAPAPQPDAKETRFRIRKLKSDAKTAIAELRTTGGLAGQRRGQAQARLNEIERELQSMGESLNALPPEQGLGVSVNRKPGAPVAGAAPQAAAAATAASTTKPVAGKQTAAGVASSLRARNLTADEVRAYLALPAVAQTLQKNGITTADVLRALGQ